MISYRLNIQALKEILETSNINRLHLTFLKHYSTKDYKRNGAELKVWLTCSAGKWNYKLKIQHGLLASQRLTDLESSKLLERSKYYDRRKHGTN